MSFSGGDIPAPGQLRPQAQALPQAPPPPPNPPMFGSSAGGKRQRQMAQANTGFGGTILGGAGGDSVSNKTLLGQ